MTSKSVRTSAAVLATIVAGAAVVSCGPADAPQPPPPLPEPRDIYRAVRGEIVQLPSDGPPPTELRIHHEHIPEFVVADGSVPSRVIEIEGETRSVPGMRAMKMDFGRLAPDVEVTSLGVGDIVAFDLFVHWGDRGVPTYWVGNIAQLPQDTELNFGDLEFELVADEPAPVAE